MTELERITLMFWTQFLERARELDRIHLHQGCTAWRHQMLGVRAGRYARYEFLLRSRDTGVQLYLDGPDHAKVYQELKAAIESGRTGLQAGHLDFHDEGEATRRIHWRVRAGGYSSPLADWPAIDDRMFDAMEAFIRALAPEIARLGR